MRNNNEVSFLIDTMIVQTLLTDEGLSKKAGMAEWGAEIVEKIKNYVGGKIDPNDKAGSLFKILVPGLIARGLGFTWFGKLLGLAASVFGFELDDILSSIWTSLKSLVTGDKPTSSAEVDQVVKNVVDAKTGSPPTEEQAVAGIESLKKFQSLRTARMLKLGMIEYDELSRRDGSLQVTAGALSLFKGKKAETSGILITVISWIFKVALASAGLMVLGDIVNKILGRPNSIDGDVKGGKPVPRTPGSKAVKVVTTQKKFKVNPSYRENPTPENWVINIRNDENSIGNMLVDFAKKVYQGLDGLESNIRATTGFQVIQDKIASYNQSSAGDNAVFIPSDFSSEKQIVDHFIDDVAESVA